MREAMAKIQVVICDRCQRRSNGIEINQWVSQRGKKRYTGDLCDDCWHELVASFKPELNTSRRHTIVATPLSDIENLTK